MTAVDKNKFVEKNAMLVKKFDRYLLEHPKFVEKIPDDALLVMQIEGDEGFNRWAKKAAKNAGVANKPTVYITITELKPVRSRIEKLTMEFAA